MPKQTGNSFDNKFQLQWKDQKSMYQVRQVLGFFGYLISLTSGYSSVKGLRMLKNIKSN